MNNNTAPAFSISLHRAALHGYLILLVGLLLLVENAIALTDGLSLTAISGIALGLFGIGGGALGYFKPERFPHGVEPAPTYLYILAGVATVFFGFTTLSLVL